MSIPLRTSGPLVLPLSWPLKSDLEPPRALKVLSRIVDGDLCHRCGSCVGICPTNVLGVDEDEYPEVKNMSACTDCDLCVKVCPGLEFDAPSMSKQIFHEVPDVKDMHGHIEQAYLAHATSPALRSDGTSGGLVTTLLLHLLETKKIDGAVVVGSDSKEPWKGRPLIARTRDELLGSMKSKYAIAPTNVVLGEISRIDGRYALVGLPCQIHGFLKAARLDKRIRERVVLTIGVFCHAAVEHEPLRYIWSTLGEKQSQVRRFISRVGKHPGTPHVELQDGSLSPVYFPQAKGYRPSSMEVINVLYRLYTPPRCLTCYDSTAEFADIGVGDPWMTPPSKDISFYDGYSFALVRTKAGVSAMQDAAESKAITLVPLSEKDARRCNTLMGEEKRWRAFRVIETRRRQGQAVPDYGFQIPGRSGKQFVLTELNMLSHIFCFLKRGRGAALRLTFSPVGYWLLRLNRGKRRFRKWRRDRFTWARRRYSRS